MSLFFFFWSFEAKIRIPDWMERFFFFWSSRFAGKIFLIRFLLKIVFSSAYTSFMFLRSLVCMSRFWVDFGDGYFRICFLLWTSSSQEKYMFWNKMSTLRSTTVRMQLGTELWFCKFLMTRGCKMGEAFSGILQPSE